LFWHVDEEVFDIDQAIGRTESALRKAITNRLASPEDIVLLEDSLRIQ
jgi:hypothetical protein